jgi:hypothetical protein
VDQVIPHYLSNCTKDAHSQEALSQLFQQLVTGRGINLADYRKQNCRVFAENMSDFLNAC